LLSRGRRWCTEGVREHRLGHRPTEIGGGRRRRPGLSTGGGTGLRWKEEADGARVGHSEESGGVGTWRRSGLGPGACGGTSLRQKEEAGGVGDG
jgi:hypothetical protein